MAGQAYTTLNSFADAVDVETTRISVEVQALLDAIDGGVSAADAATLITKNEALVTRLKGIGSGGAVIPPPPPPDPVP